MILGIKICRCSIYAFTEGDYGRAAAQTGSGYRNSKEAIIGLKFLYDSWKHVRGIFTLMGENNND